MSELNVFSTFSGIGGLELGLERAGMTTVAQVELDPYCNQVLAKHWPEVPRHDDVRTAPEWWIGEQRPRVDVVAGGPPCQPFSDSGLRLGVGDERWGWPWMADVVRGLRPRYVVMENVAALLRFRDAWGVILSDLASLGFDARWSVLPACALGSPHPRERVFLVAYPAGSDVPGEGSLQSQAGGLRPEPGGGRRPSATRGAHGGWLSEPAVDRVADGVPSPVVRDPLHALGNAVVPAVAEFVGRLIVNHHLATLQASA